MRLVHSVEVSVHSEHFNSTVFGPVCLGSFKALNRVVEGSVGRVKVEGFILYNLRTLPASVMEVIIYLQHVVGR